MNLVLSMVVLAGGAAAVWAGISNPPGGVVGALGRIFQGQPASGHARPHASAPADSSTAGADGLHDDAVKIARSWLGVPYLYGGTSKSGVDCSGLVQNVYAQLGVKLPRTTELQCLKGRKVPANMAGPGDLVFFGTPAHHVGIYIGGGEMIHAPHTGTVVRVESVESCRKAFMVPTVVYYRDVLA